MIVNKENIAISCKNVSIRYITGDFKDIGFKEFVMRKLTGNYRVTEFWADKNITFDLDKGDMLGIVGSNGAGKSTLLKAISGVMVPTEGSIEANGNIAALLELTAGFDDELTVKENTYLRGAMLGYTRDFMNKMYDSIISFAELENFQDRPFKQLSSGMKSRLAFSIACLVNPDIIILDEVLAVGDGSFREKSGNKMREILNSGVTGILVSHSTEQIKELCNKVLWLDHGNQVCFSSEVEKVCNAYEMYLIDRTAPKSTIEIEELSNKYKKFMRIKQRKTIREDKIRKTINSSDDKTLKVILEQIKERKPELFKNI